MKSMEELERMSKEELRQYAREKGIKLYSAVAEKIRQRIYSVEYSREHHGDAFRYLYRKEQE